MKTEHGKIDGDIEITSRLKMHGVFAGNVTIKDGGYLILHGMAAKSVYVEPGAVVEIPGMVAGDVTNNGGRLSITGTITGQLVKQAGETDVSETASIS